MCEPNYYLPQTLSSLFSAEPSIVETEEKVSNWEHKLQQVEYETDYYRILPLLSYKNDYHKKVLSLKKNEYLRLRWQKFLTEKPPKYVHIRLYADLKNQPMLARRKQLNGEFYGVDNKLSPVPMFPDPRKIDKHFGK